MRSRTTE